MTRFAAAATLLLAAPAFAGTPTYQAMPQQPATGNVVVADNLWTCGTGGCTAGAVSARPAIACQQVVRKLGRLSAFNVDGRALDADALAKCNARAKGGDTAVAKN